MTRVSSVVALGIGGLACCVLSLPTARAQEVQARYAAPQGSVASSCALAAPCDLVTAINGAGTGDDVVIEPGVYYSSADPLITELTNPNHLTLHAASAAQVPVIYTSASSGLFLTDSNISDIVLVTSGTTDGIQLDGGSADHIAVFASSGGLGACGLYDARLTDSVCSQSGANDPAIGVSATNPGTYRNVIRNVTAVSSGAGGYAFAATGSNIEFSNKVSNTIFDGAGGDIRLAITGTGSMTMHVDHSAYRSSATDLAGGGQIRAGAGNVDGTPEFVNAPGGNFEELPSSPTVDAGGKAPVADVDLANLPRRIGTATDIGAYELPVAPSVDHLKVLKTTRHSATITVTVKGQGLPTTQSVVVTSSNSPITTEETPVTTARASKLMLRHLEPHRRYTVRVIARNLGGTTTSHKRDFVTE